MIAHSRLDEILLTKLEGVEIVKEDVNHIAGEDAYLINAEYFCHMNVGLLSLK